jgi:WD40 repeat protein/serine/threonine protein kinase
VLEIDQIESWRKGTRTTAEAYFQTHPELRGDPRAFSLVLSELRLSRDAGHATSLDDLGRRFPEFHSQIGLLQTEQKANGNGAAWAAEPLGPTRPLEATPTVRLLSGWLTTPSDGDRAAQWRLEPVQKEKEKERAPSEPPRVERVGPFHIQRTLAYGGMGVVYQALDTRLNRPVALKMVLSGQHAESQALARFRGEALAVARLQHPNIVQIHEVSEHEGLPYIALEFVEGCNLQQYINGKPMAPERAAELTRILASTVEFAHQRGIIHRDIKPGNILIAADGTPKVTDFGLAKLGQAADTHSRPGEVVGTPNYMAPEQANGHPDGVGPATDVYALGAVLYEMLTGVPPFHGCSPLETLLRLRLVEPVHPRQLVPRVPRDLETICLKCLRKDRHERYASAAALAEDLERWLQRKPIQARPVSLAERLWKWARRHPVGAAVGSSLLLLMLLGYGMLFDQWRAAVGAREDVDRHNQSLRQAREKQWEALGQAKSALESHARTIYAQVLTNAELEWLIGDAPRAREHLLSCPAEQRGWEWHYLRRRIEGTDVSAENPPGGPVALAVFSDGKDYATLGAGGMLVVHDSATGKFRSARALERGAHFPDAWVFGRGVFSTDGALLAAAGFPPSLEEQQAKCRIGVWQVSTGKLIQSWPCEEGIPLRLTFRPDAKRVAWTSGGLVKQRDSVRWQGGAVCVADVATGEMKLRRVVSGESFRDVCFSPDGERLALTGMDTPLLVCRADADVILRRCEERRYVGRRVLFTPDGQRIVVQCESSVIEFDAAGKIREILPAGQGDPESLFLSSDGSRLIVSDVNGAVRVFDTEGWNRLHQLAGHVQRVSHAALAPDNLRLVTQSNDGTTKIWDLSPSGDPSLLGRQEFAAGDWIPSSAFDHDGTRLYVAADGRQVRVFDVKSGQKLKALPAPADVRWLALSSDGSKLAAAGDSPDGHIAIYDLTTDRHTVWRNAHQNCVTCVAFSPAGKSLASASEDGSAKVWDVATGRALLEVRGHNGIVTWVAFSHSGTEIVTAGEDGTLRFWDARSGAPLLSLRADETPLTCAVFSPDGATIATANHNRPNPNAPTQIKIWNAQTGQLLRTLTGHKLSVWNLAFSPDGKRLASAGEDGTVKIWDAAFGTLLLTLRGHGDDVRCLTFSPDGTRLISSGDDPFLRVWDARPVNGK